MHRASQVTLKEPTCQCRRHKETQVRFLDWEDPLEASTLFSIVAVLVCITTNSVRGFPVLHTLSSIYCL